MASFAFRSEVTFEFLQGILTKGGIQPIALKGPHLAYTVYSNPFDRNWSDLDVLVPPSQFHEAIRLLQAEGYYLPPLSPRRSVTDATTYVRELGAPLGVSVEIHRNIAPHDCFPVDIDGFFLRAKPFTFGQVPALGLGNEDLLLHLCIHIAKSHYWILEKHLRDIHFILDRLPISWPEFLLRAKSSGCTGAVWLIFQSVHSLYGSKVPPEIIKSLTPGWIRRLWLSIFLNPKQFPIYRYSNHSPSMMAIFLHLPSMDRMNDALRFLMRYSLIRLKDLRAYLLAGKG